jgi:hypothetical protein
LQIVSGCDAPDGLDVARSVSGPTVHEQDGRLVLAFESDSSIWERKEYVFRCAEERVHYGYRVTGTGAVANCRFFEAASAEALAKLGRNYLGANYQRPYKDTFAGATPFFSVVFNPEPNGRFRQYLPFFEYATIDVSNNPACNGGNWFFTPAPFCYAVAMPARSEWLTLGLVVTPGQNNFVAYEYQGGEGFGLNLTYQGYTWVEGTWDSPRVVFMLGQDEYDAVGRYVALLRERGLVGSHRHPVADWWRRPLFCGWGEQHWLAGDTFDARPDPERPASAYCTQQNYTRFLEILESKGVHPGTIVIDDQWSVTRGDPRADPGKWPDLRGWIDAQHAGGRHVLLWLAAWRPDGVPRNECITRDDQPVAVDPTNPEYESRLRKTVRILLGSAPGACNADGFKIAFTHTTPVGPGCERDGNLWGVELLHRWLSIVYDEAKRTRPDALIVASTANPYFADCVDMLRLNDIYTDLKGVVGLMTHRAKVARLVDPALLIDTDNYPMPGRAAWREYVAAQPALGVPTLYYATHLNLSGEALKDEDYALVRDSWAGYEYE